ncbi:hypothetical protein BGX27_008422 [Mortierella sp. AM989]|nr:hypothetical protein BGX27_008422 [Mortierella sp. AM989]
MSSSSLFVPIGRSLSTIRLQITHRVRFLSTNSCNYSRRRTDLGANNSTASTKQAKNPFSAPSNSVLAYVGPYAASLRQGKGVAFVFGACGCMAVPATLFLGNTEHVLAIIAGVVSLSPSVLLHALFRNDVAKIHVQGSVSTKIPAAIKVSATDALKLTFEKLSWRGVPLQSQVLSSDLYIQSESEKTVTWATTSATTPVPTTSPHSSSSASSRTSSKTTMPVSQPSRKEIYRIDKLMMLSNPSFSFVMDQIEHQSRLSHTKHNINANGTK